MNYLQPLNIDQADGKERHLLALPLSAVIAAAPRELRVCGCTTRKAACRLYVKGTQARSPNTSMKPKPSCTMSMVVRTASCSNTTVADYVGNSERGKPGGPNGKYESNVRVFQRLTIGFFNLGIIAEQPPFHSCF